jgi:outer membrane protein TolC
MKRYALLLILAVWCTAPYCAHAMTLSEAVAQALSANTSVLRVHLQEQAAQINILAATAPFDWQANATFTRQRTVAPLQDPYRSELILAGLPAQKEFTYSASSQAGVSRLLENGFTPSFNTQSATNFDSISQFTDVPSQRVTSAMLQLTAPLLRNNGTIAVETRNSTRLEAQAAGFDTRLTISQTVVAVTQAYWNCVAAELQQVSAREAQERVARLAEDTERLIAAKEVPAADRQLIAASLAEHTATTLSAELARDQARRSLAYLLGIKNPDSFLSVPLDELPAPAASSADDVININLAEAMQRRPDIAGARLRVDESEAQVRSSRAGILPQLDLTVGVGVSGLTQGAGVNFIPAGTYANRPTAMLTLALQWPIENSAARADLQSHLVALESARLTLSDTERSANNTMAQARAQLVTAAAALAKTRDAESHYRTALENERTRRRLSQTTALDLITVEDRYAASQTNLAQAQLLWANALAQWRYEAANIIEGEGASLNVRIDRLVDGSKR